jgi:hypothetical protein
MTKTKTDLGALLDAAEKALDNGDLEDLRDIVLCEKS